MRLKQGAYQGDRVAVKRLTNKEYAVSNFNSSNFRIRSDESARSRLVEAIDALALSAIGCSSPAACRQSIREMNVRVLRSIWLLKAKLTKSEATRNTPKLITSSIKRLKIAEPAAI
jgi:hypothetical protein